MKKQKSKTELAQVFLVKHGDCFDECVDKLKEVGIYPRFTTFCIHLLCDLRPNALGSEVNLNFLII